MPSKKRVKPKQKKKSTIFSTKSNLESAPVIEPEIFAGSAGVSSEQPKNDTQDELKKLEAEFSKPSASPAVSSGPTEKDAAASQGEQKPRRRKFKRPPPENTIRMTIRQYWRFRLWLANRKLNLGPDIVAAVLDGTDQTLVEPLVDPVIGIIDEYVPEQWVEFIEERSPILTFALALFEAEQTFSARIGEIAQEVRKENRNTTKPAPAQPAQNLGYPKKDIL